MGARKIIFILLTLVVIEPYSEIDSYELYWIQEERSGIEVVEPLPDHEPIRTPGQAAKDIIDSYFEGSGFLGLGVPYENR